MSVNEQLETTLSALIEKAVDIRFSFQLPAFDASVVKLNSLSLEAVEKLSILEQLLSQAIRAKAKMDRKISLLKLNYQVAWDKAISGAGKRPSFGDYATGKEKAADANLATFDLQRSLVMEEQTQAFANEAVDIIRLHYYGLDKLRQDVRKRLDQASSDYYSQA